MQLQVASHHARALFKMIPPQDDSSSTLLRSSLKNDALRVLWAMSSWPMQMMDTQWSQLQLSGTLITALAWTHLTQLTLLCLRQGCGSSNLAAEHKTEVPDDAASEIVKRGGLLQNCM